MRKVSKILMLALLLQLHNCLAYKEITGILDEASDLSPEEINVLRPIFNELQIQYDYLASEAPHDKVNTLGTSNNEDYDAAYNPYEELQKHFADFLQEIPSTQYDTQLPTVDELIGSPSIELTPVQKDEFDDMQSLLQETLDDAQHHIQQLVQRAWQMESKLLRINKPKIATYIYKALRMVFKYSVQFRRAAYCTYSHIPRLNVSLHHIYEGVDCYTYSTALINRIENETVKTVGTIKQNVLSLAGIYTKIAAKNSIVGKVITIMLNVTKILANINSAFAAGTNALDLVENQLPEAAAKSLNCVADFRENLPDTIQTVTDLSTCILFVDDSTTEYDFMKPEVQR